MRRGHFSLKETSALPRWAKRFKEGAVKSGPKTRKRSGMARGICVLVVIWWAVLSVVAAKAGEPVRLRVLSYNIHHARGVDRTLDLDRIARVIRSAAADLVALQEVDQGAKRSRLVGQPAELARLTGMNVLFGPNIELQGGHYGNAVLSRFPATLVKNHSLPNVGGGEQRGVMEVRVAVPGTKQPLLFLATHLDHRADDRQRLASSKAINKLVAGRPELPALLAGDMNDTPGSKTLQSFSSSWTSVNRRPLATVPVAEPGKQIDYVLYRPAGRWRVLDARVLDEAVASDHRPVLAMLEWLPQDSYSDSDKLAPR